MNVVDQHIKAIAALCQLHKVDRLFVFGSILTDKFHAGSDIDLLVKFGDVALYHFSIIIWRLRKPWKSCCSGP